MRFAYTKGISRSPGSLESANDRFESKIESLDSSSCEGEKICDSYSENLEIFYLCSRALALSGDYFRGWNSKVFPNSVEGAVLSTSPQEMGSLAEDKVINSHLLRFEVTVIV